MPVTASDSFVVGHAAGETEIEIERQQGGLPIVRPQDIRVGIGFCDGGGNCDPSTHQ